MVMVVFMPRVVIQVVAVANAARMMVMAVLMCRALSAKPAPVLPE